jgi:2-keto-3-deoxy-L-rhamnonate aldolase RhmA
MTNSLIIPNHTKRLLAAGRIAIGLGLRTARTPEIAQIAKTAGFDWLFIDCEHSAMNIETASMLSVAALGFGITPIIRVPGIEHHHATRLLDNGAQGIVVPHVDTVEDAKRIASFTRFPPVGHRSNGGAMPQLHFANVPVGEAMRLANEETLVVAMIESPAGVENCEALAATPGIDCLLIGTNDLCAELGMPGKFDDPKVVDVYKRVIAACRKHGKYPGMGGVYTPDLLEKYIGLGMQFILAGSEVSFLMAGATQRANMLKALDRKG